MPNAYSVDTFLPSLKPKEDELRGVNETFGKVLRSVTFFKQTSGKSLDNLWSLLMFKYVGYRQWEFYLQVEDDLKLFSKSINMDVECVSIFPFKLTPECFTDPTPTSSPPFPLALIPASPPPPHTTTTTPCTIDSLVPVDPDVHYDNFNANIPIGEKLIQCNTLEHHVILWIKGL